MATMPAATLITVAPTGAESQKDANPALPVTLDELVVAARSCQDAGAALVHIHIRDDEGRPTLDLGRLRDTVSAVRESTDLIVQLSTGGAVTDPFETRLAVLDAGPDSCSLTTGTVNFGDDIFANPWPFVAELYQRTQALGILPEFELFELGPRDGDEPTARHLRGACRRARARRLRDGRARGIPGTAAALVAGVAMLPAGATWSATGIGRSSLPVMLAALSLGGNLRVGMEDTLTYGPQRPARDNAELVERAARLAAEAFRPAAAPDEARRMLGLAAQG